MKIDAWRKCLYRTFGLSTIRPIRRRIVPRVERLEDRWVPSFTSTTAHAVSATETSAFTGVVANFTSNGILDSFTATINWGDGTTSAGTVSDTLGLGTISGTVTGSHTYSDEFNNLPVTVTLTETGLSADTATVNDTATVAEADVLTVNPAQPTLTATEGSSFSGRVANFVNTNAANANTADFTVSINWGDGTTTSGTLSNPAGNIYGVDGTHTYADEGNFTVIVTVADDAPGTASATATGTMTVAEGDVLTVNPIQPTLTATEGSSFSGRVANFVNTNAANANTADFTVTINWGDGTTTGGTLSNPGGTNIYAVDGTHTYAEEGTFNVVVTVADDAPGTANAAVTGTFTVAEADSLVGTGLTIAPTEGVLFSGAVGSFTDAGNPSQVASDFTATIAWGDGTTTGGTVSGPTGGPFTVSGSHTYADEGAPTLTVTLTDDAPGTASATASGTATVAEADVLSGTFAAISTPEKQAFSGKVATFSDTYTGNTASDFTATINWGDGTSAAGTVTGGSGSFTVSGSHTYADDGSFPVSVTLTDAAPGTASATVTGTASVAEVDAPIFTSAATTTFNALSAGSFQLSASGTPAPTFSLSGAPSWLSINGSNQLVGTPPLNTGNSTVTFTITATNGDLPNAQQSFTLIVNEALSIRGTVFNDFNGNGVLDSGELGLGGRTVYLDLNHDATLDPNDPTAVTDSSGNYTFSNLASGTYTVRQQVSFDNFVQTGAAANGIQVNLGASAASGINFGNVLFAPAAPVVVNASIFDTTSPDSDTAYIRGLYFALLGRDADRQVVQSDGTSISEVQYWLNQLNSGLTHEQVAQGIIDSPEHRGLEVDSYYQSFLHRSENPDERAFWVNVFEGGADEATVVEGFLNSQEYQTAHASDTLFVQDLYVDILGRQGTSDEVANVQAQFGMGATRAGLIALFVHSDEENRLAVQGFYAAYLHRYDLLDPLSSYHVNRLNGGASLGADQANVLGDSFYHEFFDDGAATVS